MVRLSYQQIEDNYKEMKRTACSGSAINVIVMVAYDVDAMAATRMLTQMLRSDGIGYSLHPVLNFSEVQHVFNNFVTNDIKAIFMINCGAVHNIVKATEHLHEIEERRVFILDNHRPIHLKNIHSRHRIVIFDNEADIVAEEDNDDIPSDCSSESGVSDSDDDSDDEDVDNNDDEDVDDGNDDEEFEEEGGEAVKDEDEDEEMDDLEEQDDDIENDIDEDADKSNTADADDEDEDANMNDQTVEYNDAGISSPNTNMQDTSGTPPLHAAAALGTPEDQDTHSVNQDQSTTPAVKYAKGRRPLGGNDDTFVEEFDDDGEGEGVGEGDEDSEEEDINIKKRKKVVVDEGKEKRMKMRRYYAQNRRFGRPTALMMMQLVMNQFSSHIPLDLIWQAILGVTDHHLRGHLTEDNYQEYCMFLHMKLDSHMQMDNGRIRSVVMQTEGGVEQRVEKMTPATSVGNIEEVDEYRFFLHRHWSLYEAMSHSPYIASKLTVYNAHGTNRLQEFLAKMGMPLTYSKQTFGFIPLQLRAHFRQQIVDVATKEHYNLRNPDILFKSFHRFVSFKKPIAAADVVHAATALMEMYGEGAYEKAGSGSGTGDDLVPSSDGGASTSNGTAALKTVKISSLEAWNEAYDCIKSKSDESLKEGIKYALDLQRTIVKKVAVMIDGTDTINRFSRLYYAFLHKPSSKSRGLASFVLDQSNAQGAAGMPGGDSINEIEHSFGRPMVLMRLGQFIMNIKRNIPKSQGGWTGSNLLPLILLSERQAGDTYIVVGISPLVDSEGLLPEEIRNDPDLESRLSPLSNFREYFKLAAKDQKIQILNSSFDTSVVEIHKQDVLDFLGTLDLMLKKATPGHMRN